MALFNRMLTVDGGENNVSLKVYEQMTADYMRVFNMLVPDMKGVYYQSYAFDMKNCFKRSGDEYILQLCAQNGGAKMTVWYRLNPLNGVIFGECTQVREDTAYPIRL